MRKKILFSLVILLFFTALVSFSVLSEDNCLDSGSVLGPDKCAVSQTASIDSDGSNYSIERDGEEIVVGSVDGEISYEVEEAGSYEIVVDGTTERTFEGVIADSPESFVQSNSVIEFFKGLIDSLR